MVNSKKIQVVSDQGFDEDELEDIMTEIQGLEKEFVQLKEATKKNKKSVSKEKKDKTVLQHAMETEVKESLKKTDSHGKTSNLFDSRELDDLQKDLDDLEEIAPVANTRPKASPVKEEKVAHTANFKPKVETERKEKIMPLANAKPKIRPNKTKDKPMKEMASLKENYVSEKDDNGVMNFSGVGRMKRFELDFAVGNGNAKLVVNDGISIQVAGIEIMIDEDDGCQISAPGGVRLNVPIE